MGKSEVILDSNISELQEKWDDQYFQELPREKSFSGNLMFKHDGFWCAEKVFHPIISFQKHFKSEDSDILLATLPKAGTTWLKAIVFSIVHRNDCTVDKSPLINSNPHALVPFEYQVYGKRENPDLRSAPGPLILSTHIPHNALPRSIFDTKCKIIYLCRNPLDQFISQWHFIQQIDVEENKPIALDKAFELFLQGKEYFGPFWDQILGYWKASFKNPEKVLFLKYEDLKRDTINQVRNIAKFLELPFSIEEEKNGLIEDITKLCGFESLKNMDGNKPDKVQPGLQIKNSSFFRKGEVGDWVNYLTPDMVSRGASLIEEKFGESGLKFDFV
ncbi:hypothetical protein ACH5RR_025131 [Cinchona calisaya]|uniref:Sulfotransferase n=1 Tax=Cinchona calisaya TaxID=153742 RepID=A0ABD2YYQ7_9GENT